MKKIKKISVCSCDYTRIDYTDGESIISGWDINDIQKTLENLNIDYVHYYYDINGGENITLEKMEFEFYDFTFQDQYVDYDENVYSYTIELVEPINEDILEELNEEL